MPIGKFIKFTVNKVKCAECNKTFNVNNYKNNMPTPRIVPCSHVPKHSCGNVK